MSSYDRASAHNVLSRLRTVFLCGVEPLADRTYRQPNVTGNIILRMDRLGQPEGGSGSLPPSLLHKKLQWIECQSVVRRPTSTDPPISFFYATSLILMGLACILLNRPRSPTCFPLCGNVSTDVRMSTRKKRAKDAKLPFIKITFYPFN